MNFKKAVVAGLAGTTTKTLFSYLSSLVEDEQVSEPELLGTLLTKQTGKHGEVSKSKEAVLTGYAGHFATGVGFATVYDLLWRNKIGKPDTFHGLVFGLANGLIGTAVWRSILHYHPDPPKVPLKIFTRNMLINHVLFGITVAAIYQAKKKKLNS